MRTLKVLTLCGILSAPACGDFPEAKEVADAGESDLRHYSRNRYIAPGEERPSLDMPESVYFQHNVDVSYAILQLTEEEVRPWEDKQCYRASWRLLPLESDIYEFAHDRENQVFSQHIIPAGTRIGGITGGNVSRTCYLTLSLEADTYCFVKITDPTSGVVGEEEYCLPSESNERIQVGGLH